MAPRPADGTAPIPISLVAHHAFCPRRAWLEAMGETTDTHQMAVGTQAHRASDDPQASRPNRLRATDVQCDELGVSGRCDSVELDDLGRATVVEFKSTPVRRRAEVTEPMVVQLALQAAALRESGVDVIGAAVQFTEHQTRVDVPLGSEPDARARWHLSELRSMLHDGVAPEPLIDDPRCLSCSHAGVCLPDERALGEVRRRVLVADPDTQFVHLTTPGARASLRSGRIRVEKSGEKLADLPIERVMAVVLHGNIDVSSGLLRELLWRRLPVVWCSGTGRVIGWAASASGPNGGPRVRQHVASANGHLGLAAASSAPRSVIRQPCCDVTATRRRPSVRCVSSSAVRPSPPGSRSSSGSRATRRSGTSASSRPCSANRFGATRGSRSMGAGTVPRWTR